VYIHTHNYIAFTQGASKTITCSPWVILMKSLYQNSDKLMNILFIMKEKWEVINFPFIIQSYYIIAASNNSYKSRDAIFFNDMTFMKWVTKLHPTSEYYEAVEIHLAVEMTFSPSLRSRNLIVSSYGRKKERLHSDWNGTVIFTIPNVHPFPRKM
jgi:hypothetical protein